MNLGNINLLGGRFEEAERWFRRIQPGQAGFVRAQLWIVMAYVGSDRYDDALPIARESYAVMKGAPIAAFLLGIITICTGNEDEGHALLKPLLGTNLPLWSQATTRGFLGDETGMFADLERALVERSDWTYSLPRHPWLRRWRDDPRFHGVVAKLGLPGPTDPLA